ncbi:polysaccharide pyruvyl transferase family protein [uncultured Flavobacterium sp.]|uniref:polysaccharide pyruvyl transferase family protein n=1 Tax=uncultured Flavobacterium sp. TaxID=165435 RepID=UPI0029307D58|nr:polysaccharide pyruvyl transferase family protein [uncultured Flavobacterium sp.]
MKISFLGYYGSNFGDLLMLNALVDYYSKHYNQINIYTYGNHVNLYNAFSSNPNLYNIKVFGLSGEQKISYKHFMKTVKGSQYIIWGGGTCFMDQGGTGGIKFMLGAYLAKVAVLYLGIGIDSHFKLKTKLIVFSSILLSKALYLRDEKSLKLANKLSLGLFKFKVDYVPDIANVREILTEQFSGDYIVFCCRDLSVYSDLNNEKVNHDLATLAIRSCKELGLNRIVNLVCDAEIDENQSKKATDLFLENNIQVDVIYGSDVDNSLVTIQNAKFVITSRLHPAVVAQNLSVSYSLYNYSDKNRKFVEEVNEQSRLICRYNIDQYIFNFHKPKSNNLKNVKQNINDVLKKYIS